jgi:hypothetical protein
MLTHEDHATLQRSLARLCESAGPITGHPQFPLMLTLRRVMSALAEGQTASPEDRRDAATALVWVGEQVAQRFTAEKAFAEAALTSAENLETCLDELAAAHERDELAKAG